MPPGNSYGGDPLDWWAGIAGQSTPDYLGAQATQQENDRYNDLADRANRGDISAINQLEALDRQREEARWDQFQQGQVRSGTEAQTRLDPYSQAFNDSYNNNQVTRNNQIAGQTSAFNSATAGNAALLQQSQGAAASSNAWDQQTIGNMNNAFAQSSARDAANVGQLQDVYGTMGQLSPSDYVGDAQSNAADVARQNASYNQLGGWASGANDISSDAGLVGMQQDVYDGFGGFASGANAISSDAGLVAMQQGVYDDYGQFASGGMDLESQAATATADAEALAAQKEALGEFRDRMDPRLTDAERFLYMQSRLQQEQGQRANRDANYRELERRGMGGSTMALSNLNASSAEASNTRALQDLGANAKAVDRAEKALVNYGNMSSTIADQSFERDFSTKSAADRMAVNNNQQRLAGIAGQGQMATNMRSADDDMRRFNSEQQMQGLQGQGTMANAMRTADDAMRTGNANRQLSGAQSQATLATDMRNASDAINMFNKEQQGIQVRHQDNFRAQQQDSAWGRATDVSDAQFRQTEGDDRRTGVATDAGLRAADSAFDRTARTVDQGMTGNRDYMEGYDRLTGRTNEGMRDNSTDLRSASEFELGRGSLLNESQRNVDDTTRERIRSSAEDRRAREAVNQAYRNSQAAPRPQTAEDRQDPSKLENWA